MQSISQASLLGLGVLLSFSSAFRRWRFESFSGYGFAWFRHETCWGSAFSHALPKDLFLGFCRSVGDVLDVLLSFSIVRFVGDVSRVFLATVLRGLGTKPAGVLLFRMRSPKTFLLGFAWLPAGFPSFCFFLVGSKGNVSAIFLAAVSQWLRDKTCWGSAFRCAKHFSSIFAGFRRFAIFQYSAFRRWRFESFFGYGFAWFKHETCLGSAFSHALPKDLFLGFCRSVGDVLDVLLFFSSAYVLDVLLSFFQ